MILCPQTCTTCPRTVHQQTHTHTHTPIQTHVHTGTQTDRQAQTGRQAGRHAREHTHTHTPTNTHTHTPTNTHIHMHTTAHTHTHQPHPYKTNSSESPYQTKQGIFNTTTTEHPTRNLCNHSWSEITLQQSLSPCFHQKPTGVQAHGWSFSLHTFGATCGVMVSTSAFLASHHCESAGSSLSWGLNFRALVCDIFWSSSSAVFSRCSSFLSSFID